MSKRSHLDAIAKTVSHSPAIQERVRRRFDNFSAQQLARERKKLEGNRTLVVSAFADPHFNRAEARFQEERAPGPDMEDER